MSKVMLILAIVVAGAAVAAPLAAQQDRQLRTGVPAPLEPSYPTPSLIALPDSVRERAGYQHWKGAAIGGGLGALAGLGLALAAHGQCSDCTSESPAVGQVTLVGAGLGAMLGFLVGLASPRYRWHVKPAE